MCSRVDVFVFSSVFYVCTVLMWRSFAWLLWTDLNYWCENTLIWHWKQCSQIESRKPVWTLIWWSFLFLFFWNNFFQVCDKCVFVLKFLGLYQIERTPLPWNIMILLHGSIVFARLCSFSLLMICTKEKLETSIFAYFMPDSSNWIDLFHKMWVHFSSLQN